MKKSKGFTLIELLVVISVIGLLASVILVSLNSARVKARDTRRLADIKQFQTALELYYDKNDRYPISGGATSPNSNWSNSGDGSWITLQAALNPYLSKLSIDPKQSPSGTWPGSAGEHGYAFYSRTDSGCVQGQWYMIVYQLENAKGPDPGLTACDGEFYQYGGIGSDTNIKTIGVRVK